MTIAHHGDATVTIDVHDGALEATIEVKGKRIVIADSQARDLTKCLTDQYPSLIPPRPPAHVGSEVHGYDQGVPVRTVSGEKACGCFITDVCECYAPPQTWGSAR